MAAERSIPARPDASLSLRSRRRQFVIDELPELEAQNEEMRTGWDRRFMLRLLWIKSKRLEGMVPSKNTTEDSQRDESDLL